jgi:hypothetical protein
VGKRRERRQLAIIGLLATEGKPLPAYVISTRLYHLASASGDLFVMARDGRVVRTMVGPDMAPDYVYGLPGQW